MIDTHCHILPQVDDGPSDHDLSLQMARVALDDGIKTIIATPHIVEGFYEADQIGLQVDNLAKLLREQGMDLELKPGAEVPVSVALSWKEDRLANLCLASSSYLLLETADVGFGQMSEALFRLRLAGIIPVLAHPERIGSFQRQPDKLAELLCKGEASCQITVSSLEGLFGRRSRAAAIEMARSGLVQLVGSDAHSAGHRAPKLRGAHDLLASQIGEDAADLIIFENPNRLLSGKRLTKVVPKQGRKGFLSRFVNRGNKSQT